MSPFKSILQGQYFPFPAKAVSNLADVAHSFLSCPEPGSSVSCLVFSMRSVNKADG